MGIEDEIINELMHRRVARLTLLEGLIIPQDVQLANNLIADVINILENLYIAANWPQDEEFVSLTPKKE